VILVTGASGFVGSALVTHLAQQGLKVRACSRMMAAHPNEVVESVSGVDLLTATDLTFLLAGVTCVVHAAARVHVMHETSTDPLADFRKMNVDATLRLARQAAAAGVKRFIFLSTIKVNGESTPLGQPFLASDQPNPHDAYAISKLEAERGLQQIAAETGLEVVIIRPPLVYGPGVEANFGRLLSWVNKGIPLPLGCATVNRRSFVAIDNLIDFVVTCIRHPKAANQIFLVSDGRDVSTAELLRGMANALNRKALLVPIPVRWLARGAKLFGATEAAQRLLQSLQVDIVKNEVLLGWVPPLSLDQGLQRVASGNSPRNGQGAII
jgi:nucleoside-diphosphate-sugar epimerase